MPELNPSEQRCLTTFFTGDFASLTVHFVSICVKNQKKINYLFSLLIMYGISYMFRHYVHCHPQGALLVPSERCSIEEQDRILWMGVLRQVAWCAPYIINKLNEYLVIWWFFIHIFTGILIFKGLTARRLYKSFGVKGLIFFLRIINCNPNFSSNNIQIYNCLLLFV
jgi:hypothetical protein